MNKKTQLYSLIGLLTSSMISGLLITNYTQAQSPNLEHDSHHPSTSQKPMMMTQFDQHFIEMMIPHHQGAIDMSDLALSRAKHPQIKNLAIAIQKNQAREIQQMRAWYKSWYGKEVPEQGMMSDHQMSGMGNMGMDLVALKNAADFDKEFIRQMIPHHQMAVVMAQKATRTTKKSAIRHLAQSIIKSQSTEIKEMRKWYQTWYHSNVGKI
jgi:uncharacterized protein (DUF305 family)